MMATSMTADELRSAYESMPPEARNLAMNAVCPRAFTQGQATIGRSPPFPPLPVPPAYASGDLKPFNADGLSLSVAADAEVTPFLYGYFTGPRRAEEFRPIWVLRRDGITWMSFSPKEMESLALSYATAHGDVLIMGLGMGGLVDAVRRKPDVRSVTVIENDANVIELNRALGTTEGCIVIHDDAKTWKPANRYQFDRVLLDIWPTFDDEHILDDCRHIYRNVGGGLFSVWSIELSFARWFSELSLAEQERAKGHGNGMLFAKFADELGVPLVNPAGKLGRQGYERWCFEAMINTMLEEEYFSKVTLAVALFLASGNDVSKLAAAIQGVDSEVRI